MAGIVNKDSYVSRLRIRLFLILFNICISPILHFAYPPPPPPHSAKKCITFVFLGVLWEIANVE